MRGRPREGHPNAVRIVWAGRRAGIVCARLPHPGHPPYCRLAGALGERKREIEALRAAVADAERSLGAAAEQQQQHSDTLQQAREQLAERVTTTQRATSDCQTVQQRRAQRVERAARPA